jgi:hypothetical protein
MADVDARGQYRTLRLSDVPKHWRITAICLRCSHCAELPIAYLVRTGQLGAKTMLGDLEETRLLRCTRCNRRNFKLRIETDDDPPPGKRRRTVEGDAVVIDMPRRRSSR